MDRKQTILDKDGTPIAEVITSYPVPDPATAKIKREVRAWLWPLRMLIQSARNELVDTQGGSNLDIAQQVITQIEVLTTPPSQ
jgi:hypothetical protein